MHTCRCPPAPQALWHLHVCMLCLCFLLESKHLEHKSHFRPDCISGGFSERVSGDYKHAHTLTHTHSHSNKHSVSGLDPDGWKIWLFLHSLHAQKFPLFVAFLSFWGPFLWHICFIMDKLTLRRMANILDNRMSLVAI